MSKIVILGSSPAGVQVIETLRAKDTASPITVIAFDGYYPYKRDLFASYIAKSSVPEDMFCRSIQFYEKNNIDVILDKKITRINIKRKKIFFEDKEQLDYDVLIVTDTPENRFADMKGTGKAGVYGFKKLKDIDQIFNSLPLIDTVAIQADSWSGLQAASAFQKRDKEVLLVCSQHDFITKHFDENVARWLHEELEKNKVRILADNAITEILGEKDAKAIRLKSGKVFSAQVILFCETNEDLRLFADCGLNLDNRFLVDQHYRTNVENIFAVDQACNWNVEEPITPPQWLAIQGQAVAAAIEGQEYTSEKPLVTRQFDIEGLFMAVIGEIGQREGRSVHKSFHQESGQYKSLFVENGCLVGAILVNCKEEIQQITKQITEKTPMEVPQDQVSSGEPAPEASSGGKIHPQDVSTELIDN